MGWREREIESDYNNHFGISCHRSNVMILIGQKKKKEETTFVPIFENSKLSSPQGSDIGKISK